MPGSSVWTYLSSEIARLSGSGVTEHGAPRAAVGSDVGELCSRSGICVFRQTRRPHCCTEARNDRYRGLWGAKQCLHWFGKCIVMCMGDYRRGIGLVTQFIDHLYTHDSWLHFTDHWHTDHRHRSITSSTSRFLATDFNTGTITFPLNYTLQTSHIKSSLHSRTLVPNSRPFYTNLLVFSLPSINWLSSKPRLAYNLSPRTT
jgi:hypothetical protein